ncbi:MAG: hypothetical protein JXQ87_05135 [Bacteroidia bacterium]
MGLRFRIILLLLTIGVSAKAQELGFGFTNFIGSGMSNDLGLNLSYAKPIKNNAVQFELEMRSIDWGNSLNLGLGFKAKYKQIQRVTIGGVSSAYFGVSPFQQKAMATYGLGYLPYIKWQSSGKFYAELAVGLRYNTSQGYSEYGPSNQFEFPLRITSGWLLNTVSVQPKPPRPEQDPRLMGD